MAACAQARHACRPGPRGLRRRHWGRPNRHHQADAFPRKPPRIARRAPLAARPAWCPGTVTRSALPSWVEPSERRLQTPGAARWVARAKARCRLSIPERIANLRLLVLSLVMPDACVASVALSWREAVGMPEVWARGCGVAGVEAAWRLGVFSTMRKKRRTAADKVDCPRQSAAVHISMERASTGPKPSATEVRGPDVSLQQSRATFCGWNAGPKQSPSTVGGRNFRPPRAGFEARTAERRPQCCNVGCLRAKHGPRSTDGSDVFGPRSGP